MANCGNFLSIAVARCGVDVGMGKMFLVYPDATPIPTSELTTTAINEAIVSGDILGVIKGWHTIVGAPVAEVSVERVATSEMKLIKQEIAADTLTFEASLLNREVLADVVAAGNLYCILVDDMGNSIGEKAQMANEIKPMLVNFSGKATTSFQSDKTTDKGIAVTARYLVGDLDVIDTRIDSELIESKSLLLGQVSKITTQSATVLLFELALKDKATNKTYNGAADLLKADVTVTGIGSGTYTIEHSGVPTGSIGVSVSGSGYSTTAQEVYISINSPHCYMKEAVFTLGGQ